MTKKKLVESAELPGAGGLTIGYFWSWAFSDVLSNATRGVCLLAILSGTHGQENDSIDQDCPPLHFTR